MLWIMIAIEGLLAAMPQDDPLRDNVLEAQAKRIADVQACTERLLAIHRQYRTRMEARRPCMNWPV